MSEEIPDSVEPSEAAPVVDLPEEFCAEIRDFATRLPEMTYHEILGVEKAAESDEIRRAFFARSRTYHPDRYFNKELGPYGAYLHEIYKRIVAAHDVLQDPKLRVDYEKAIREKPDFTVFSRVRAIELPGVQKLKKTREPGTAPSLRDREGLRSKSRVLENLHLRLNANAVKGQGRYEEAKQALSDGDLMRAASLARLALAFDPRSVDCHELLADVLPRVNEERARVARAKGEMLLGRNDYKGALEFLSEVVQLVPTDAELVHQVAELYKEQGDVAEAVEFAEQACELDEKNLDYLKSAAFLHMDLGNAAEARRFLQRAWGIDPVDRHVKKALAQL